MHQVDDESGTTLVELLVSIIVIAVALTALSGTVVTSLTATTNNERETVATATALELVEQYESIPWDAAVVYANETGDASADAVRWRSRLAGDGTYDGREVVDVPGPASAATRDDRVPPPWVVSTRQGVEYSVDVYPTLVDLSGDGTADAKRFTAVASWESPFGGTSTLAVGGDRAPTQGEAASTSTGARILQITAAPRVATLDATDGTLDGDLAFTVRFSQGLTNVRLTYDRVGVPSSPPVALPATVPMTPTELDGAGGIVAARVVLSGEAFVNGDVPFTVVAGTGLAEVRGTVSVEMTGGPWDAYAGDPTPTPSPTPSPTATPTYGDSVSVNSVVVSSVCSSNSNWQLTRATTVRAEINGVTSATGSVSATFPAWTSKGNNNTPADTTKSIILTNTVGNTWEGTVPGGTTTPLIRPGASITFSVEGLRDDGDSSIRTQTRTAGSGC